VLSPNRTRHRAARVPRAPGNAHPPPFTPHSEITAEGKRVTKLDQILLNGNNVALVSPP
jgi:hypothetical protein